MAIEGSLTFSDLESTEDSPESANDVSRDDLSSTHADATAAVLTPATNANSPANAEIPMDPFILNRSFSICMANLAGNLIDRFLLTSIL